MRISFDFDNCLADNRIVQFLCKTLIAASHDIFILTSRDPSQPNIDVFELAKNFNIKSENILMTNGTLKVHKFLELKLDIHFDNSFDEVLAINNHFDTNPFKKFDHSPAILTNFDSDELSLVLNTQF